MPRPLWCWVESRLDGEMGREEAQEHPGDRRGGLPREAAWFGEMASGREEEGWP